MASVWSRSLVATGVLLKNFIIIIKDRGRILVKIFKPLLCSILTVLACLLVACNATNEEISKSANGSVQPSENNKYNLLFIMVDQMRFDAMSRAGNIVLQTPNIDKLAREGVAFNNAYTTVAVCGPARSAVLTGHTAENTGVNTNEKTYLYDKIEVMTQPTFDEILTSQGYHAEYYGKWHSMTKHTKVYKNPQMSSKKGRSIFLHGGQKFMYMDYLNANVPLVQPKAGQGWDPLTERSYIKSPMDKLYGKPYHKKDRRKFKLRQPDLHGVSVIPAEHSFTAFQSKQVINAIERLKDIPFSIQLNLHFPHAPMLPVEPYASMYKAEDMPVPASIGDSMENSPYKGANGRKELTDYRDPAKVQHMTAAYYALIHELDDWMGKIFAKLDEHNLTEKTLVIFTSDHGEMLGAHGMREKNVFYEESAHIPLLVRLPQEIKQNIEVEGSVSTLDLFSTILDYLNMGQHPSDGKSLRGLIEGTDKEHGQYVVTEWDFRGPSEPNYMVVKEGWKLMVPYSKDSSVVSVLYDLNTDPHEMNNLIGRNKNKQPHNVAKALELRSDLLTWLGHKNSKHVHGVSGLVF